MAHILAISEALIVSEHARADDTTTNTSEIASFRINDLSGMMPV